MRNFEAVPIANVPLAGSAQFTVDRDVIVECDDAVVRADHINGEPFIGISSVFANLSEPLLQGTGENEIVLFELRGLAIPSLVSAAHARTEFTISVRRSSRLPVE